MRIARNDRGVCGILTDQAKQFALRDLNRYLRQCQKEGLDRDYARLTGMLDAFRYAGFRVVEKYEGDELIEYVDIRPESYASYHYHESNENA